MERSGRLQPEDSAQISLDVCEALSAPHARGVLHRERAAGNVIRDEKTVELKLKTNAPVRSPSTRTWR